MNRQPPPDTSDPLALAPEVMRNLGYRTVDLLVDLLSQDHPVVRRADRETMRGLLDRLPPEGADPYDRIEDDLRDRVLAYRARVDAPGYLAFIPGSTTWPGALADFISSALNIDTCWWLGGAGPGEVELLVLDWFRIWIGFPDTASGVLVSGGSAANITALACARESLAGAMSDDLMLYASDQTHSSIARAARLLGFRPGQVRILPTGRDLRLDPHRLRQVVAIDRAAGRRPLVVVANAGATGTGAIDPLAELVGACRDEHLWLHVDAAYGGFAVLDPRGKAALSGLDGADSVALDPHKWLFQPFECGALLVRDGALLQRAFETCPPYMKDAATSDAEVNFSDRGIQLTRAFRALKVWMSVRYFGVGAFRAAVGRALDLAELAARRIEASANLELLAPPSLGIVAFRRVHDGLSDAALDAANAALVEDLAEVGDAFVSSVRVHGRYAVRLCILNHATEREDVDRVLDYFEDAPIDESARRAPAARERHPPLDRSWAARAQLDAEAIRRIGVFADVSDAEAALLLAGAHERLAMADEGIIEEWSAGRQLFGVLDGVVRVRREGRDVAMIPPGGHFGEIAALDWGSGYSYPRLAAIAAVTTTRLVVIEPGALADLMRAAPRVAERIERSAAENIRRVAGV